MHVINANTEWYAKTWQSKQWAWSSKAINLKRNVQCIERVTLTSNKMIQPILNRLTKLKYNLNGRKTSRVLYKTLRTCIDIHVP